MTALFSLCPTTEFRKGVQVCAWLPVAQNAALSAFQAAGALKLDLLGSGYSFSSAQVFTLLPMGVGGKGLKVPPLPGITRMCGQSFLPKPRKELVKIVRAHTPFAGRTRF